MSNTVPEPGTPEAIRQVEEFEANVIRNEGARLAQEARDRQAERERARRELQERVSEAVDVAREALGRDAVNPVALATLASAVLGRRFLG